MTIADDAGQTGRFFNSAGRGSCEFESHPRHHGGATTEPLTNADWLCMFLRTLPAASQRGWPGQSLRDSGTGIFVNFRVSVTVEAEHKGTDGFADDTVRTISENAKTLRFRGFGREKE